MILNVDPEDPTPVYQQLRTQIVRMVAAGTLPSGTRLPTIRQLASDLGVAKGTVARTYETLLRDGVVTADRRRGTSVADHPGPSAPDDGTRELHRAAQGYAVTARQLGADYDTAVAAVHEALASLQAGDLQTGDHRDESSS